ncbi:AAA family ATPase [uncultured Methanobrevibacter sp.]|uniref:AAA family ATPase n=1 Tax=uncultured Methanobrevibacter sp. TaxID=253161 RepID=UPI0026290AAB
MECDNLKSDNKSLKLKKSELSVKTNLEDIDMDAQFVVLKAEGYPFNFGLLEGADIEISNMPLFQQYALEQWGGTLVKSGDYLFDQKIIPDYAFKVVTVYPEESVITDKTSIIIESEEKTKKEKLVRENSGILFDDVVGQENAKKKTKLISKYLQDPEKFGDWAPKNVLFYGLPGTGKTMMAKALANELNVKLFLIKATSLIGDHVGDAANKIHELFSLASKSAPALIFIDEIDAIALHRSYQSLRGDVAEIVNSLLTEMDGIDANDGVVTIAATNNPSSIDFAIRSRFEEEIEFKLPNDEERKEIIELNLNTFPIDYDLDVEKLVKLSKRMSGRDIKEKMLKTALHNAIINDKKIVDMDDISFALDLNKYKKEEVKGMFE